MLIQHRIKVLEIKEEKLAVKSIRTKIIIIKFLAKVRGLKTVHFLMHTK
jgi:hypothetical protein